MGHRVAADIPSKGATRTRTTAPARVAREKHGPEHGLQLQVSWTIEDQGIRPIHTDKAKRVEATTTVHAPVFRIDGDHGAIPQHALKFG
jgi:hypothetical protein